MERTLTLCHHADPSTFRYLDDQVIVAAHVGARLIGVTGPPGAARFVLAHDSDVRGGDATLIESVPPGTRSVRVTHGRIDDDALVECHWFGRSIASEIGTPEVDGFVLQLHGIAAPQEQDHVASVAGFEGWAGSGPMVVFVRNSGIITSRVRCAEVDGLVVLAEDLSKTFGAGPRRAVHHGAGWWVVEWCRPTVVARKEDLRIEWTFVRPNLDPIRRRTRHTVYVLPAQPRSPFLVGTLEKSLLDCVCVRAQGARSPRGALRRFLRSTWRKPGQLAYTPDAAELAAPESVEVGLRTDANEGEAVAGGEAGALILDLPVLALGDVLQGRLDVTCHGLAKFVAAIAALFGLPSELLQFEAPTMRLGVVGLNDWAPPENRTLVQHWVAVVGGHRRPRIADLALARTNGPVLQPLDSYEASVLARGGPIQRDRVAIARPSVIEGEDLALFRDRLEQREDEQLVRLYLGQTSPPWVQAIFYASGRYGSAVGVVLPRDVEPARLGALVATGLVRPMSVSRVGAALAAVMEANPLFEFPGPPAPSRSFRRIGLCEEEVGDKLTLTRAGGRTAMLRVDLPTARLVDLPPSSGFDASFSLVRRAGPAGSRPLRVVFPCGSDPVVSLRTGRGTHIVRLEVNGTVVTLM